MLIPASFGWFKSKRQSARLNSYHPEINLGKGKVGELKKSYDKMVNAYSEGKINNEQYTNLKTEISVLYEEIFKKRIVPSNDNRILMEEIKDAYAKGMINELHYKLLIEKISESK